jgi:prevent-host-death family protein
MSEVINVHEAKTHLSRLLDKVYCGEEIVLGKAGKPYARLVPIRPDKPKRKPGRMKGKLDPAFFDALPEEELAAWEGR